MDTPTICRNCGEDLLHPDVAVGIEDKELCRECEKRQCGGCGNVIEEEYGQYCPICQ